MRRFDRWDWLGQCRVLLLRRGSDTVGQGDGRSARLFKWSFRIGIGSWPFAGTVSRVNLRLELSHTTHWRCFCGMEVKVTLLFCNFQIFAAASNRRILTPVPIILSAGTMKRFSLYSTELQFVRPGCLNWFWFSYRFVLLTKTQINRKESPIEQVRLVAPWPRCWCCSFNGRRCIGVCDRKQVSVYLPLCSPVSAMPQQVPATVHPGRDWSHPCLDFILFELLLRDDNACVAASACEGDAFAENLFIRHTKGFCCIFHTGHPCSKAS